MHDFRRPAAEMSLAVITIIWGGTFVVVQDAVRAAPVAEFMTVRFGLAAVVLALIAPRRLARITVLEAVSGTLIGVFLGSGYLFQSFGLRHTESSKAAFLTGVSIPLVPVLGLLIGRRPTWAGAAGVALATLGIALVTFKGDALTFGFGEKLVLGCATVFALHLITQGEFAPRCDPFRLAVVQLTSSAGVCAATAAALPTGWDPGLAVADWGFGLWWRVGFLAVFATAAAFVVQAWAQSVTTAIRTALICSLELVFGAIFGVWLAAEVLTVVNWTGCGLILGGIVLAEWKPTEKPAAEPLGPSPAGDPALDTPPAAGHPPRP